MGNQIAPRTKTAELSLPAWASSGQGEPPWGTPPEKVSALLAQLEAALAPAGEQEFAVVMDRLFRFARTFGLSAERTEDAVRFYRETLAELPPDVLAETVERVVRSWKWPKLPLPADFREQIPLRYFDLKDAMWKLRRHQGGAVRTQGFRSVGSALPATPEGGRR